MTRTRQHKAQKQEQELKELVTIQKPALEDSQIRISADQTRPDQTNQAHTKNEYTESIHKSHLPT